MIESKAITTRQAADLLLAAAFVAVTQIEVWIFAFDSSYGIGIKVGASIFTALASASLAWRRSHPARAFWANAAGVVGTIAVGFPGDVYQWTNLIALYSVSAHGANPQRWVALLGGVGGVLSYFFRFPFEGTPALVAFVVALWVMGWLAGRIYGARLEEIQLRHEVDLSRRLAEANEQRLTLEEGRVRIARELHDIIGHTVNVMVVHAGAGRRATGVDEIQVRQAFDTIESTGRRALEELDRVLALLRGDESVDLAPLPGLDDLNALAALFSDSGLAVEVDVTGTAQLPASVGLAAYRIVQEALTNVLRHSGASEAVVKVRAEGGSVDLSVVDNGDGDPSSMETGRGITGMRERADVHGGSLDISRSDPGGVEVRATLKWEPYE